MTIQELEQCILLYGKDIYSFCMHLAKEKESADDLYQDTFLEATKKIASIRYEDNPKSYLLTSLYNAPCTMPYALKADYELTMRAPVSPAGKRDEMLRHTPEDRRKSYEAAIINFDDEMQ